MAAAIYRGKKNQIIWEDDNCRMTFELLPASPSPTGPVPAKADQVARTVSKADMVDMEGSLDLAGLDAQLEAAVREINAWLQGN